MPSARYNIAGAEYHANTVPFYAALAQAHGAKIRPLCLCRDPGVEMYIARFEQRFLVKRMPGTGTLHTVGCDSFEAPATLSGMGELADSAIQEDIETGQTALKFGFALSKGAQKKAPVPSEKEADSVKADARKLTLRATLHYLWEQAGFNRWSPAMEGKRSWNTIRKYLLKAAADKTAKGVSVSELLYVPEFFVVDQKAEIEARRLATVTQIVNAPNGAQRYMLIIGELNEIAQARYGHKLVLKHLPAYGLMLDDDTHRRLLKRFGAELDLWNLHDHYHMVVIATCEVNRSGTALVVEVALMPVTAQWIPVESEIDAALVAALEKRRYQKMLRYNLPATRPLATALLTDTETPTALYIEPPGADEAYLTALGALIVDNELDAWTWKPLQGGMPPLPAPGGKWRRNFPASPARAQRADSAPADLLTPDYPDHAEDMPS